MPIRILRDVHSASNTYDVGQHMLIVAGLSLKNLKPRVWDPTDGAFIPSLKAVMVSYAEVHALQAWRRRAMAHGIHVALGLPPEMRVYLDNGAFAFRARGGETPVEAYCEFVREAKPDWWPIPQDFIPAPGMDDAEQRDCFERTMAMNLTCAGTKAVPVMHVSRLLAEYVDALKAVQPVWPCIALGAIVPNLLRAPKAMAYGEILAGLLRTRQSFSGSCLHVFGVGGTATLHLAALLGMDSVDSSGWRARAARGLVQLPGSGERMAANLGSWRGRELSACERETLARCACPSCTEYGPAGLEATKLAGFVNRAVHNLHVLLAEADDIDSHLAEGTYAGWYESHLQNSNYLPLIRTALQLRGAALAR